MYECNILGRIQLFDIGRHLDANCSSTDDDNLVGFLDLAAMVEEVFKSSVFSFCG